MSRTTLGVVALLLLVVGFTAPRGPADSSAAGFAGGCVRVGIVLAALWLALPQLIRFLSKTPKWMLVASGIGIVVCAVKPLLLIIVIPLLGLLWFFGHKLRTKVDKPIVQERRPRRRSQAG